MGLIKECSIILKKIFPKSEIVGQLLLFKKLENDEKSRLLQEIGNLSSKTEVIRFSYKNIKGTYAFKIFVVNNIFDRIISNLTDNLEILFKTIDPKLRGAFLAGFFDAEGNVNKLDRNLRWSQKTEHKKEKIIKLLKKEGYHVHYDTCNICIGYSNKYRKQDFELFKKQVLPHIRHSEKNKEAKELLDGYYVRDDYKLLVSIVALNPGVSQKAIAERINRIKCHRELRNLAENGFLKRYRNKVDESFKYYITTRGLKWIGGD